MRGSVAIRPGRRLLIGIKLLCSERELNCDNFSTWPRHQNLGIDLRQRYSTLLLSTASVGGDQFALTEYGAAQFFLRPDGLA